MITWTITQTDYQTANGFIFTAHWTATQVDDGYTASIWSTCSWQPGTPTIPYANVTMDEVLDWCYAAGVDKDATEAAVEQQIQNQINPPIVSPPLPWVTP